MILIGPSVDSAISLGWQVWAQSELSALKILVLVKT